MERSHPSMLTVEAYPYHPVKQEKSFWQKHKLWIILTTVLSVLTGFGIATFFLWPRIPEVRVLGGSMTSVDIRFISENYIDYTVLDIVVRGSYKGETLATGHSGTFKIRAMDTTDITIPIKLSIGPEAIQECAHGNSLPVQIETETSLKLIDWTGIRIRQNFVHHVPCPARTSPSPLAANKASNQSAAGKKRRKISYSEIPQEYIDEYGITKSQVEAYNRGDYGDIDFSKYKK